MEAIVSEATPMSDNVLVADQKENIGLGRRRTILYEDVRVLCALGEGFIRIPRQ